MERDNCSRRAELLAPAGSLEILKAVALAGADAVYAGGEKFGARAYARNFTEDELKEGLDYLHLRGKKLYLTVNTLVKEREIGELWDYLLPLYEAGLDAVIVQDIGVLHFVKERFPGLAIHASTQMGVAGAYGARMLLEAGCSRIVAARELSLEEISDIYQKTGAEIECFVHGSLCYCYSGQCLMSSMIGGRSGNRGRCAQPCRLPYWVSGKKGAGRHKEGYFLSLKDLCGIERIPELIHSGAYSFKIEGRMKQAEYAAGVTGIYREYIDRYEEWQKGNDRSYKVLEEDYHKLLGLGNRSGFTDGYFLRQNGREMMAFENPSHGKGKTAGGGQTSRRERKECSSPSRKTGEEYKEKIKGILRLFCGSPAMLVLEYNGLQVEAMGGEVQPSEKQPLSEKTVLEKMKKTGNTPFAFSELEVEMGEGVFLTIGALNQLRRKGLELLQEEILQKFRREPPGETGIGERYGIPCHKEPKGKNSPPQLRVLAETLEQCQFALRQPEVQRIYIEGFAFSKGMFQGDFVSVLSHCASQVKKAGKECYLALPYIFRKKTAGRFAAHWQEVEAAGLDGFLARNYGELQFLKEQGVEPSRVQGDYQIYACSNEALQGLHGLPLAHFTLPVELNFKELLHLDCENGEMVLYGHQPLMVSAQCVHKNTSSCDKKSGISYLEDRLGRQFPVRNQCQDCYNVIYNISPLSLMHHYKDVCRLGPAGVRISFTTEKTEEMGQVFGWYRQAVKGGIRQEHYQRDFTNGHWKRGVE